MRNQIKYSLLSLAVLMTLAGLWIGFWQITDARTKNTIDAWVETERRNGRELLFDDLTHGGFPFSSWHEFKNLRWRKSLKEHAGAKRVKITANFWESSVLEIEFENTDEYSIPFGANKLSGISEYGKASLKTEIDGTISSLGLQLKNSLVNFNNKPFCRVLEIKGGYHSQKETILLNAEMREAELISQQSLPFGKQIEKATISARIAGDFPASLNENSLSAWSKKGGVIETEGLFLKWGALDLNANGTLTLSENGMQPEGAFSGQVANYVSAVSALKDGGHLDEAGAETLLSAISSAAEEQGQPEAADINIPISIQNGSLYVGPALVAEMPKIRWR